MPESASTWVARLTAVPMSPEDYEALQGWLAASPSHTEDLRRALALWEAAAQLKNSDVARTYLEHDLAEDLPRTLDARSASFVAFLRFVVAAAIVMTVALPSEISDAQRLEDSAAARTMIGQIRNYALPDRSLMTVAADSVVQVSFADGRRDATLSQGEAFFEVQRDMRRPFIVTAGEHRVTVTGTKFNVRSLQDDAVEVAVTEGSVAVSVGEYNSARTMLRAGDVFHFPAKGIPIRRAVTAEQASAWRSGRLHFNDARLDEVLREVNRYAAKPISADAVDLNALTLTGRLTASDTEAVLVILKELFKFEVAEFPDRWELSARR